jgi:hypothetical protein
MEDRRVLSAKVREAVGAGLAELQARVAGPAGPQDSPVQADAADVVDSGDRRDDDPSIEGVLTPRH